MAINRAITLTLTRGRTPVLLLPASIYAVTVSSQVTGGVSETLCAHIFNPTERLTLRVTLEAETGSTVVILEETVGQDYYKCKAFQVCLLNLTLDKENN